MEPRKRDLFLGVLFFAVWMAVLSYSSDNQRADEAASFVGTFICRGGIFGAVAGRPFLGLVIGFGVLFLVVGGLVLMFGVPC